MRYTQQVRCSDDTLPRDELDDLFDQLEQVEPPPSLIAHILSTIKELPLPKPIDEDTWNDLGTLVVRRENGPPN
jgi:hypothetical protein